MTVEDLRDYHARYFVPENMIVSVFGDINPQTALAVVRRDFGGLKAPVAPPAIDFHRSNAIPQDVVRHKKTGKATGMVLLGYPDPSIFDKQDHAAMVVLDAITSGYRYPGGWLHNELHGAGLVYFVDAMQMTGPAPGYFIVIAQTQPAKIAEVVPADRAQPGPRQTRRDRRGGVPNGAGSESLPCTPRRTPRSRSKPAWRRWTSCTAWATATTRRLIPGLKPSAGKRSSAPGSILRTTSSRPHRRRMTPARAKSKDPRQNEGRVQPANGRCGFAPLTSFTTAPHFCCQPAGSGPRAPHRLAFRMNMPLLDSVESSLNTGQVTVPFVHGNSDDDLHVPSFLGAEGAFRQSDRSGFGGRLFPFQQKRRT